MATDNGKIWGAIFFAYFLIVVGFGVGIWSVTTINRKGHALREWATTIPKWAKHTVAVHDHPPEAPPPPVDHVQPPPDPPPFW